MQTVGTGVANAGVTLDGMRNARMAAINEANDWNSQQTSDASKIDANKAGRKAAWSYLGQSAKQQIKDRAFTAFTGQKAERENHGKVTFGKVGQTYVDQNGQQRTMSMGDAKQRNKEAASNIGKDVVAKMTKPVDKGAMSTKSGTQEFGKPNVRPDIGPD